MGKVIVAILATLAALTLVVYFVGAARMTSTALDVPSTTHSPAFGITWTMLAAVGIGLVFWKVVKGK